MQTILEKISKLLPNKENKDIFDFNKIKSFYTPSKNNKIGLEYERLSLDKNTFLNADYERVSKIIEKFAKTSNWQLIYDDITIIGAKDNNGTSISLEPGCQMEISLKPIENIAEIDNKLNKIINLLDEIAEKYDVIFVGYGISPKAKTKEIKILNKKRYLIMNNYLPNAKDGSLCPEMMRKTAGIQINVDFSNNEDLSLKLKFYNLIMPIMTALCANSPIEKNILTDKKTVRSYIWQNTGSQRCNFFYKNVFKNNFFNSKNIIKSYINEILNVPIIYIERENKKIPINGKITFKEFIQKGYSKYFATNEDYFLHQSLCFPDVRLKNYIEIRNHDSNNPIIALALCAFYKGIQKSDFKKLLKEFSCLKLKDIKKYNDNSINCGINYKIGKCNVTEILEKLINISSDNLDNKEKEYLNPLIEIIKNKKTSADRIIKNNISNSNELIKYILNS